MHDGVAFRRPTLSALRRLVPSDVISYSELDRIEQRGLWNEDDPPYDNIDETVSYWDIRHEHPTCRHQDRTGDFRARKVSDFMTRRELHQSRLYAEWFRPCGVEFQMSVGLDAPLRHTKVFIFDRSSRDFDERDRAVLDLVRPQLAVLDEAARARHRLRAAIGSLERTDRAVVLLERRDGIAYATPAARRLLARYFGHEAHLPQPISTWLRKRGQVAAVAPLTLQRDGAALRVHLTDEGLLLEEVHVAPRLTPREREVLDLVADGKTNAEIATSLWVSPGTVRRHLENVFAKLGVHTRTAAAAFATRRHLEA